MPNPPPKARGKQDNYNNFVNTYKVNLLCNFEIKSATEGNQGTSDLTWANIFKAIYMYTYITRYVLIIS